MLLWPTRYDDLPPDEISEYGRIAYQELNVPCNFTNLVTVLEEIRDAITNNEPTNLSGVELAIGGVQTAIENQVLTVDLGSLETVLTGIQTAIENQVLTVDLGSLETVLTGIQTAIENQEAVDLTDFQVALTTAISGVQTAIENQEAGGDVDLSGMETILAGIQTAIENLSEEDMQIINNLCCNGGCGCDCDSNTTPDGTTPDPITIDPDDTLLDEDFDDTEIDVTDIRACRAANYFAEESVIMLRKMGGFGDGASTVGFIVDLLITIFAWLSPVPGDELIATSRLFQVAVKVAAQIQIVDFIVMQRFEDMANYAEANAQELVCKLYGFTSAADLNARFESFVDDMYADLQGILGFSEAAEIATRSIVGDVIGPIVINRFVANLETVVPDDYTPRYLCNCSQYPVELPPDDSGYVLLPVPTNMYSDEVDSNTPWVTVVRDRDAYIVYAEFVQHTWGNANPGFDPTLVPDIPAGYSMRAFVTEMVSLSPVDRLAQLETFQSLPEEIALHNNARYESEVQAIDSGAFAAQFDYASLRAQEWSALEKISTKHLFFDNDEWDGSIGFRAYVLYGAD